MQLSQSLKPNSIFASSIFKENTNSGTNIQLCFLTSRIKQTFPTLLKIESALHLLQKFMGKFRRRESLIFLHALAQYCCLGVPSGKIVFLSFFSFRILFPLFYLSSFLYHEHGKSHQSALHLCRR